MSVISAIFENYDPEKKYDYVKDGVMVIERWGDLDISFQTISDIKDFTEQTESEFKTKFDVTDLVNNTEITEGFHYGYQGNQGQIPAIFVEQGNAVNKIKKYIISFFKRMPQRQKNSNNMDIRR